eukprot:g609.t1
MTSLGGILTFGLVQGGPTIDLPGMGGEEDEKADSQQQDAFSTTVGSDSAHDDDAERTHLVQALSTAERRELVSTSLLVQRTLLVGGPRNNSRPSLKNVGNGNFSAGGNGNHVGNNRSSPLTAGGGADSEEVGERKRHVIVNMPPKALSLLLDRLTTEDLRTVLHKEGQPPERGSSGSNGSSPPLLNANGRFSLDNIYSTEEARHSPKSRALTRQRSQEHERMLTPDSPTPAALLAAAEVARNHEGASSTSDEDAEEHETSIDVEEHLADMDLDDERPEEQDDHSSPPNEDRQDRREEEEQEESVVSEEETDSDESSESGGQKMQSATSTTAKVQLLRGDRVVDVEEAEQRYSRGPTSNTTGKIAQAVRRASNSATKSLYTSEDVLKSRASIVGNHATDLAEALLPPSYDSAELHRKVSDLRREAKLNSGQGHAARAVAQPEGEAAGGEDVIASGEASGVESGAAPSTQSKSSKEGSRRGRKVSPRDYLNAEPYGRTEGAAAGTAGNRAGGSSDPEVRVVRKSSTTGAAAAPAAGTTGGSRAEGSDTEIRVVKKSSTAKKSPRSESSPRTVGPGPASTTSKPAAATTPAKNKEQGRGNKASSDGTHIGSATIDQHTSPGIIERSLLSPAMSYTVSSNLPMPASSSSLHSLPPSPPASQFQPASILRNPSPSLRAEQQDDADEDEHILPWNTTPLLQRMRDEQSDEERAKVLAGASRQMLRDLGNYGYPKNAPNRFNPAYWLPVLAKFGTNAVGLAGLTLGYGIGSMGRVVGTRLHENPAMEGGLLAFLRLNGLTVTVTYPKGETHANLTDSPFMVANHQSYLDGVIIATELKYPKIMSMSSMRDTPMIGPFMKDMEVIWVDRDDAGSRKNALKGIKRHAKSWKRGERALAVFPEGTTTSGRTILPFKTGVFSPGKPIRPCVILYTGEADLGQPMMIRSKAADGHIVLREYIDSEWFDQFLAGMVHSVIVKVCRVYYPDEREQADPDLYAENVHKYMKYEYDRLKLLHDQRTRKIDLKSRPGYSKDNCLLGMNNASGNAAISPSGDINRCPVRISPETQKLEIVVGKSWRGHMPYSVAQLDNLRPWFLAKNKEMILRKQGFFREELERKRLSINRGLDSANYDHYTVRGGIGMEDREDEEDHYDLQQGRGGSSLYSGEFGRAGGNGQLQPGGAAGRRRSILRFEQGKKEEMENINSQASSSSRPGSRQSAATRLQQSQDEDVRNRNRKSYGGIRRIISDYNSTDEMEESDSEPPMSPKKFTLAEFLEESGLDLSDEEDEDEKMIENHIQSVLEKKKQKS